MHRGAAPRATKKFVLQGADMSSPGGTLMPQSETVDWTPLNQLDAQEAQEYPAGYNQARRRLVCHLLSTTATTQLEEGKRETSRASASNSPFDDVDAQRTHIPAEECAAGAEAIQRKSKGKKQQSEKFHDVSSLDRLTSNEPSVDRQPASHRMGRQVLKVLALAATLAVGALMYASVGGGFPRFSEGVRTFLPDQAEKVRSVRPGQDVRNLPMAPRP